MTDIEIKWEPMPSRGESSIADMIHREALENQGEEGHVTVTGAGRAQSLRQALVRIGLKAWTSKAGAKGEKTETYHVGFKLEVDEEPEAIADDESWQKGEGGEKVKVTFK